jgi:hypothetical protein
MKKSIGYRIYHGSVLDRRRMVDSYVSFFVTDEVIHKLAENNRFIREIINKTFIGLLKNEKLFP